jgi:hypothetical protein
MVEELRYLRRLTRLIEKSFSTEVDSFSEAESELKIEVEPYRDPKYVGVEHSRSHPSEPVFRCKFPESLIVREDGSIAFQCLHIVGLLSQDKKRASMLHGQGVNSPFVRASFAFSQVAKSNL